MNWGKWIILSFIMFALFIATLVTVCIRQDVGLVSSSYYNEELLYQQQMKRMQNVSKLEQPPVISVKKKTLTLEFAHLNKIEAGEIKLFRPSSAKLDRVFKVNSTRDQVVHFDLKDAPSGMYRAKFRWTMNGAEYYHEEIIYI